MPEIFPFRAIRYATHDADTLGRRLAPPYDVISPEQRQGYAARDPRNVVHLILPEERAGDGADNNKYTRAGQAYREWQREGILVRDAKPALYVLHQKFSWEGKSYLRRGFLARLGLRPFSDGVVLPHEKTLSGPKVDRLNLFRATQANLSPIFALYDDPGDIERDLQPSGAPQVAVRSDDGVENLLWPVDDPAVLSKVVAQLHPLKAYIADGHHRYETGLAYAKELDGASKAPAPQGAHHAILAYFCGLSDAGLLVLPTHRLLHSLPRFDAAALATAAGEWFTVEKLETLGAGDFEAARARLAEAGKGTPAFLMLAGKDRGNGRWLLRLKPEAMRAQLEELPRHPAVRELDVSVLHGLLFQRLLQLSPQSQERQENLRYVKDAREAVQAAEHGEAQAAFVLNATRLSQVRAVAEAGEVMPQKSTFFHPKLPSGLLFNPLAPDEKL